MKRSSVIKGLTSVVLLIVAGLSSSLSRAQEVVSPPVAHPVLGRVVAMDPKLDLAVEIKIPNRNEISVSLRQRAADRTAMAAQRRAQLESRAAALGVPMHIERKGVRVATLVHITEGGKPIYAQCHNIAAADTIGVDELWAPNSVTAIASWPTGGSRFVNPANGQPISLSGAGVTVGMWEVPDGGGGAAVQTTHQQLTGRVTQPDSISTFSGHATAVAGTIGAAGGDGFTQCGFAPGTFNYGNHSRGMAYGSTVHAYDVTSLAGEFSAEADPGGTRTLGGLRLSNHSYGLGCGWVPNGSVWLWFGDGSPQQDWKFGAYLGTANGLSPREWDLDANVAPFCLMIVSAGNSLESNGGPGSLPAGDTARGMVLGLCVPRRPHATGTTETKAAMTAFLLEGAQRTCSQSALFTI